MSGGAIIKNYVQINLHALNYRDLVHIKLITLDAPQTTILSGIKN